MANLDDMINKTITESYIGIENKEILLTHEQAFQYLTGFLPQNVSFQQISDRIIGCSTLIHNVWNFCTIIGKFYSDCVEQSLVLEGDQVSTLLETYTLKQEIEFVKVINGLFQNQINLIPKIIHINKKALLHFIIESNILMKIPNPPGNKDIYKIYLSHQIN